MEPYRKWIIATLTLMLIPLLVIGGFNFLIDPLWNFNHAHQYNRIQLSFNERQQKTNRITFGNRQYDSLIMGSSRITYINQYDFKGYNAYNYALSNMLLGEYYDYARYAQNQNGRDFNYIILGLDFFATNKNLEVENSFESPDYYFAQAGQLGYRFKTLLSSDVLKYAWRDFDASRNNREENYAYTRDNVKILNPIPAAEKKWRVEANLKWYSESVYGPGYSYGDVRSTLQKLKADHPHSQFVVFTTPISDPLFQVLVEQGKLPWYEQWLRDTVEVFGEVYNFMYPNSITTNLDNYYDASHFYPPVGTLIAHRLMDQADPSLPADFGVRVTAENLEEHLEMVRKSLNR
ncbi:hypothetical protein [Syntrophomonas erecta]